MNPTALLRAAGISTDQVEVALPGLRIDRVKVRPAPAWLEWAWGRAVSGMALGNTVYLRRELLETNPAGLGGLLVHELVHVHQWRELGLARFLWKYVAGYLSGRLTGLSHRDAYHAIPIEVEARRLSADLQRPLRAE